MMLVSDEWSHEKMQICGWKGSGRFSSKKKFAQRLASQDRSSAYFPLVEVPASKEKLKNQRIFSKALQFRVCRFFFHQDIGTRHQCCQWRDLTCRSTYGWVWGRCTAMAESQNPTTNIRHGRYLTTLLDIWPQKQPHVHHSYPNSRTWSFAVP